MFKKLKNNNHVKQKSPALQLKSGVVEPCYCLQLEVVQGVPGQAQGANGTNIEELLELDGRPVAPCELDIGDAIFPVGKKPGKALTSIEAEVVPIPIG